MSIIDNLSSLYLLDDKKTRSITAENPTGEKGKGAMAIPNIENPDPTHLPATAHLGQGWKTRPFLYPKAGETVTIMDVNGPGIINHIWMVTDDASLIAHGRSIVLRFYWDNEEDPSVEVPVTDFFCIGHDIFAPVNSIPVNSNPSSGMNCFWAMPFREHARITVTNESTDISLNMGLLAYQITYQETEVPKEAAYFHAQWRRKLTAEENPYVILDDVKGSGKYIGTFLAVQQLQDDWFGEGEAKFYIDGDDEFPTIAGTGLEDYFIHSYGFPSISSSLYVGNVLEKERHWDGVGGYKGRKWSLYRWHIPDPIYFQEDIKLTLQALGGVPGHPQPGFNKRSDDFASVAFWYQTEPHNPFPPLPSLETRVKDATSSFPISIFDIEDVKLNNDGLEYLAPIKPNPRNRLHQSYRGFFGNPEENGFITQGVTLVEDRKRSGFLMNAGRSKDPLTAEWAVDLDPNTEFSLKYILTFTAGIGLKSAMEFEAYYYDLDGNKLSISKHIYDKPRWPHELIHELFTFENGAKVIGFSLKNMNNEDWEKNILWFYPEVRPYR